VVVRGVPVVHGPVAAPARPKKGTAYQPMRPLPCQRAHPGRDDLRRVEEYAR
jgi:hypothetical protein